ncbi:hypothetical protein [Candidatus Binatus sp.]|jgi:hypothetical protein
MLVHAFSSVMAVDGFVVVQRAEELENGRRDIKARGRRSAWSVSRAQTCR